MKLKEILTETSDLSREIWLRDHLRVYIGDDYVTYNKVGDKDELPDAEIYYHAPNKTFEFVGLENDGIVLSFHHGKWSSPVPGEAWKNLSSMSIENATFDELYNLPNVEHLGFIRCTFNTLQFDKEDDLSGIEYLNFNNCKFNCGLLGLLKSNLKLKAINRGYDKVGKALDIVVKHMKGNRDLAECAEELIDAGFEEYAKL